LITVQNLVTVSHIVCAHVEGPKKFFGTLVPVLIGGVAAHPPRVAMPSLVAVGQNVWSFASSFSRSLKAIGSADFHLVFYSNYRAYLVPFPRQRAIFAKKIPTP